MVSASESCEAILAQGCDRNAADFAWWVSLGQCGDVSGAQGIVKEIEKWDNDNKKIVQGLFRNVASAGLHRAVDIT